MDNINFKKVLDDGELFNQQANYEDNFEKINQFVVPKITDLETDKVDKVEGKGLSTNDFSNEYKEKIDVDIPAQLNDMTQDFSAQLAQTENDLLQSQYKHRPKNIQPLVVFTFDDGTTYDLDVLNIFNAQNIKGTLAITLNDIGRESYYMTAEQIKQFEGWEIASHSKTGAFSDITTLTDAQLEIELKESKEGLKNLGFDVKNFIVPYGFIDDRVSKMAAKYYRATRVSGAGNLGSHNKPPINTFRLNSFLIGESAGSVLADWKTQVDLCLEKNTLLIFIAHSNKLVENSKLTELNDLITYIKAQGIDIVTMDEALDVFENQVDTNLFKIGADGTVGGQYGKIQHGTIDTKLATTPIADFTGEQTTINPISAGNSAGFPSPQGGTLITIKADNTPQRSLQLANGYNENSNLFYRDFASDGTPSVWKKLTDSITNYTYDTRDASSPITDFEYGISFVQVTSANSTGFPVQSGWMLETKRPQNIGNGYQVQIAHRYNSTDVYKRVWKSTNEWSEWAKLNA